jgi:predicted ATPase
VRRAPHRETVVLLVKALQLFGQPREAFEAAAHRARSRGPRHHNKEAPFDNYLPLQLTSFVGRDREIAEILVLMRRHRLVTLTGFGGIGKTRTALEVGARVLDVWRDGVWFIDLESLSDGAFIAGKVASALRIRRPGHDDQVAALANGLKARQAMLILDNCEHLASAAAAIVSAILHTCPHMTILATSRERLRVSGEAVYRMAMLPLPERQAKLTANRGRSFAALKLFAERAAAADYRFKLTDQSVGIVADICRRLDGNALAIELAAARLPTLGLSALHLRLDEHFDILTRAGLDTHPRQRGLRATIDWSYDLLDETERVVFRRLAVFAGGLTVDAAEAVCTADAIERPQVADVLWSLVEKSLVVPDLDSEAVRYSLLSSTRTYAMLRLREFDEHLFCARRHAEWVAQSAERFAESYVTTPKRRWLADVRPEVDNVRTALEWALSAGGDAILAGRIACGLRAFWNDSDLGAEGRRWAEQALALIDADSRPSLAAGLWGTVARLSVGKTQVNAAKRAISLFERIEDRLELAGCCVHLANGLGTVGEFAEAEQAVNRALVLYREVRMTRSLRYAAALADRATIIQLQGRLNEARIILADAVALGMSLADELLVSQMRHKLAELEFAAGDARRAALLAEEALKYARRFKDNHNETWMLCNIAGYRLALGEVDAAETAAREALTLASGRVTPIVEVIVQHLACAAALSGHPSRAARLLGYVEASFGRQGYRRGTTEQKIYEILTASLSEQLSDTDITAFGAEGMQFTEDQAVDEARATW